MYTVTQELIEAIRAAHGDCTDYRIAKLLDAPHQSITQWKRGRSMDDGYAIRAAQILGRDPRSVVFSLQAEHARDPAARDFWRSLLSAAASVVLFLCAAAMPDTANAFGMNRAIPTDSLFIMSSRLLSRLRSRINRFRSAARLRRARLALPWCITLAARSA